MEKTNKIKLKEEREKLKRIIIKKLEMNKKIKSLNSNEMKNIKMKMEKRCLEFRLTM